MRSPKRFGRMIFLTLGIVWLVALPMARETVAQTGLSAIASAAKNPLLGRWKSDEAVIEIRADGGITINDEEYVYKVKNSVITVTSKEGSLAFPFALDGDTLTVNYQGRDVVYTRLKGKDAQTTGKVGVNSPPAGGRIIPEFVGKWCYLANLGGTSSYRSDKCFTLYQNGTYEYSSEVSSSGAAGSSVGSNYDSGQWTATANSLTVYSKAYGKIVYSIELRNHPKNRDPMIVVDGDAYVTQTQRRPW